MSELEDLEKSIKGVEKAEGEVRAAFKRLHAAESELGTAQKEIVKSLETYEQAYKRMKKALPGEVPPFLTGQRIVIPEKVGNGMKLSGDLSALIEFS